MRSVSCPNLCEACPIRDKIDGDPAIMAEIGYSAEVRSKGKETIHFEFRNGMPVGERTSTIGVANDEGFVGFTFRAPGSKWDGGHVEEAFEGCTEPTVEKGGFFRRERIVGCSALKDL